MRLPSKYLNKLADKMLNKQDQAQALRKIAQRRDWKSMITKCHDKITAEYKFWLVKADNQGRNTRLKDLTKDIAFIKSIENKEAINETELSRLKEIANKYNIN